MIIAIIDDVGFGTGPGLAGKELYVELLAKLNEEILGNKVIRISLGGIVNDGISLSLKGSKTPVLRVVYDKELIHKLRSLFKANMVNLIHANILNARYPKSIVKVSKQTQTPLVTTVHDWTFVCPARWAVKFPSFELCYPGFHLACLRSLWNLAKLNSINRISFIAQGANQYFALRHLIRNSNAVISPSNQLAQAIQETTHLDNIYSIPNPVSSELLELEPRYGGSDDEARVAFYGRLTFEKGAHLIPVLAKDNPDISFEVMGDGPLASSLKDASNRNKNIKYHGFVSNERKFDIIRNCAAVIMPSLWREAFGYSTVEAFALGKPIVGFALGGVQELVEDSGCGLLARPGEVAGITENIRKIVYDRDLSLAQGKRGREYVESKLNMASYAKTLESIYRKASNKN